MFNWFKKSPQKDVHQQYREMVDNLPRCWIVYPHFEEDGAIYSPSINGGSDEYPTRINVTNTDRNYGEIHSSWKPKHEYDCGRMTSSTILDNVYTSKEEAEEVYSLYMVDYANALVNKGFLLLCEYSKDK